MLVIKLLIWMSILVGPGRSLMPRSLNTATNWGRMKVTMPITTAVAKMRTSTG